tara:strand:+ start:41 stop:2068 length:2028 start_codon:yes stop_codon:yes gene_type:complete
MTKSKNEIFIIVLGIYVMLILMILHIVFFKYEISSLLNIKKFKIPSIQSLTSIIPIFEQIFQIVTEVSKDKFNIIKDKLSKFKFNPIGLILSLFDSINEGVEEESPDDQTNIVKLILGVIFFCIFCIIIVKIISGVATGGILAVLTNMPSIIGYLIVTVIIFIGIVTISILTLDNTLAIIQCAEGLDASGNRKDRKTMQEHEKLKMKLCKYWIDSIEPVIIYFPTINGKKNDIKVTQVIKDQTGKIIKVLFPGNVTYGVIYVDSLPDEDSVEHNKFKASGDRIIYILADNVDLLKKNVNIFKDLKDEIYLPVNIYEAFRQDYKDNMMKYYGYNNIYYMFLQPFVIMMILGLIMSSREMFIGPQSSQGPPRTTPPSPIIIAIIKIMILLLPLKYMIGLFSHLDLLKEDDVQAQMILVLFEIFIYFFAGGSILSKAVIHNRVDIINLFGISGVGGSLSLIFIACAYTILMGDLLNCELLGKSNCKLPFYTLREQIKTCNDQGLNGFTDLFTNFSNKHNNNNIGYARIKDKFTQSNIVYDCKEIPWDDDEASEKVKIIWKKIWEGRAKPKDFLLFKKYLFGLLVASILVGYILKYTDKTIEGNTVFVTPGSVLAQFKPFLGWFNIGYLLFNYIAYGVILAQPGGGLSENIVPVSLSLIPDILIFISAMMMYINVPGAK